MSSKDKTVPEVVIELVSDKKSAHELTFEMLPQNDPEAGEGFAVMTDKQFLEVHASHGDIGAGQATPAVLYGLLCTCKLVCACGAALISGDHTSHPVPKLHADVLIY
jgi:hypothetical protein